MHDHLKVLPVRRAAAQRELPQGAGARKLLQSNKLVQRTSTWSSANIPQWRRWCEGGGDGSSTAAVLVSRRPPPRYLVVATAGAATEAAVGLFIVKGTSGSCTVPFSSEPGRKSVRSSWPIFRECVIARCDRRLRRQTKIRSAQLYAGSRLKLGAS